MRAPLIPRMRGGIDAAVKEIRRVRARAEAARSSRARVQTLIAWTDTMIEELELENLRNVRQVSPAWRPRLTALLASLPVDVGSPHHLPRTPLEALELIYEVQELLFAIKNNTFHPSFWRSTHQRR